MERTITLGGTERTLKTPTYYGLQLIDEYGGNRGSMIGRLPAIIAALLTDAEPLDSKGLPVATWSPIAVAKMLPMGDAVNDLWTVVSELIEDAVPESKSEHREDGSPLPRGAKKRSAPPASSPA